MTAVADIDAEMLNDLFERTPPPKIVEWAVAQFGQDLVMSSSFGADSALLIHMAVQVKPDIKIIFGDTGYHFPETHQFMEQLRRRFNLNVWTYRTKNDPLEYLRKAGEENPQWRMDDKACCAVNKTEPMERAMKELAPAAWLRGIRRDQAKTRTAANFVEWDKRFNTWAVSPLLNWTGAEIEAYLTEHYLPKHPLVAQGYPSIGCNPLSCTSPVRPGQDPRSGRWIGREKLECGINLGSLDSANQI